MYRSPQEADITSDPIPFAEAVIKNGLLRQAHVIDVGRTVNVLVSVEGTTAYEIGRLLKEAIYGEVNFGWSLTLAGSNIKGAFERTKAAVAIKRSDKQNLSPQRLEDPFKEIAAMQFLQQNGRCHPNIVHLIDCLQDDNCVYSVLEYHAGGELFDRLDEGALIERQVHAYFSHILQGMIHLQRMGICHRDMSLENLLISNDDKVVIIDFGMCLRVPIHPVTGEVYPMPPQGSCGKKHYKSPEIYANDISFNGFYSDMWSLGVILFTLFTGQFPYDNFVTDKKYALIRSGRLVELIRHMQINVSSEAADLLRRMLNPVPSERLTIDEILVHPWMQIHS
eukprot:gene625-1209_t